MMDRKVEKYRLAIRILHWVHAGAFVLLFLTGLVLFVPVLGFLAEDSWTRVIHRVGATVFILAPVVYTILDPRAAIRGIKQALTWGQDDIVWLTAAPRYYFLGDEQSMPPQGSMNTSQKMWWFMVLVFGVVFVITGLVMWFGKASVPPSILRWMVFVHDVAFIVTGAMFFVHIYLSVFHPLMNESWASMTGGKISVRYARTHYGKWYQEVSRNKERKAR